MYWNNVINFYNNNFNYLLLILFSYIPVVFLSIRLMKKYNPLPIKNIMFIWNIILAIFSAYCVKYISIPLITHNLFGNKISICTDIISIKDDTLAKWRFYFILSKFPEMLDTAWIIFRKKPI